MAAPPVAPCPSAERRRRAPEVVCAPAADGGGAAPGLPGAPRKGERGLVESAAAARGWVRGAGAPGAARGRRGRAVAGRVRVRSRSPQVDARRARVGPDGSEERCLCSVLGGVTPRRDAHAAHLQSSERCWLLGVCLELLGFYSKSRCKKSSTWESSHSHLLLG